MDKLFFIIILSCFTLQSDAQTLGDPQQAFAASERSGHDILLVFSGSDWCIPCIQFEKRILNDSAFISFAATNLIILKADFPQKKKINSILKSQYESLADQYDPNGDFPYIVLLTPAKKLLANLPYNSQSSAAFIAEIKKLLQ